MLERQPHTFRGRRPSARLLLIGILVLLVPGVLAAQTFDDELADLRATLAESFEVLPLSDGWLLQPLDDDAGFRTLQLEGSEMAIDGVEVSADEIRARLGELADPVVTLSGLSEEARLAVLGDEGPAEEVAEALEEEIESVAREEEEREAREARQERRTRHEVNRSDAQVVVGSNVTIEEDEVARDVVVVGGSLTIEGLVKGDAVAIGGGIDVSGEVTGDVAAIGASVELGPDAVISGDAVSIGGTVDQAPGAVVEGMVQEVPFFPSLRFGGWSGSGARIKHGPDIDVDFSPAGSVFGFGWELFGIAVLVIFAALTLLIAKNPVERVGQQAGEEPWKSGLVGLLSQILFFPLLVILVLILVISIVGIPFLLLLPFAILALALIGLLGYTAVALKIGRWSEERFGWSLSSPFLALLVGIGLIEVWSLVAELLSMGPGPIKLFALMFGLFGGLLCYVVLTIGFGAAILSRVGTAPGWDGGSGLSESSDWNVPLDGGPGSSDVAAAGEEISELGGSDLGGGASSAPEDWMGESSEPPGEGERS